MLGKLDAHYPKAFEQPTFPSKTIPMSMASREANLIGYLSPEKGQLMEVALCNHAHSYPESTGNYAHNYAVQYSHTNNEYHSWDKFVEELEALDIGDVNWATPIDFDPRFLLLFQ